MSCSFAATALVLALSAVGGNHGSGGRIMPPGSGPGWGFPNGAPDGYGWVDYGTNLPLGADRTPDYYFPRHFALPPAQIIFPTYYNPYLTRGQRYIPYTDCGGDHPAGGPALGPADMPVHPYNNTVSNRPLVPFPTYSGRATAPPENIGQSGLIP